LGSREPGYPGRNRRKGGLAAGLAERPEMEGDAAREEDP